MRQEVCILRIYRLASVFEVTSTTTRSSSACTKICICIQKVPSLHILSWFDKVSKYFIFICLSLIEPFWGFLQSPDFLLSSAAAACQACLISFSATVSNGRTGHTIPLSPAVRGEHINEGGEMMQGVRLSFLRQFLKMPMKWCLSSPLLDDEPFPAEAVQKTASVSYCRLRRHGRRLIYGDLIDILGSYCWKDTHYRDKVLFSKHPASPQPATYRCHVQRQIPKTVISLLDTTEMSACFTGWSASLTRVFLSYT